MQVSVFRVNQTACIHAHSVFLLQLRWMVSRQMVGPNLVEVCLLPVSWSPVDTHSVLSVQGKNEGDRQQNKYDPIQRSEILRFTVAIEHPPKQPSPNQEKTVSRGSKKVTKGRGAAPALDDMDEDEHFNEPDPMNNGEQACADSPKMRRSTFHITETWGPGTDFPSHRLCPSDCLG